MARPRLEVEYSITTIGLFAALSLPIVILSILNIIRVFQKKKSSTVILDALLPLLILLPLFVVVTGMNSLFGDLLKVYAFIPVFLLLFGITTYVSSLGFLYLELGDLRQKNKEDVRDPVNRFNRFLSTLDDKEWALSKYVIYLFVIAILFFIYPLFTEQFTIPLGGDYTQQQIPFYTNGYDDWWHFIKTGEFPMWDPNTFLGANNIGSNAFYYSINPFFLPILLFPRDLIPQGIAVLMICKFVLAALTMRWYLKYMGAKESTARLFAFMFAFSGWTTYYLWFNHFMEVAVVFPLVFLGIEKVLKEKSPYLLIISLGLMGLANYFFLVTICFIGVLYAMYRYFQLIKTFKGGEYFSVIGIGIFGFAIGILAGGAALFPGISVAMFSDRVTQASYLDNIKELIKAKDYSEAWKWITDWNAQGGGQEHKVYYPLITYFFPVLSDRSVSLLNTSSYDNTISSIFAYTPIILLLVPSMINSLKEKKLGHFIAIGFFVFALFTPFFYNALHGFTKEYGRWQLIVTFSLVTYTALSFDKRTSFQRWYFDVSFLFVTLMMAFTYLWAFKFQGQNNFGNLEQREFVVFYQFVIVVIVYGLFRLSYQNKNLHKPLQIILSLEAVVMGTITMIGHGFISYRDSVSGGLDNYNKDVTVVRSIQALDGSYYRMSVSTANKGNENYPMRVGYNGLSAFHSLYNFELMEFNYWNRVNYNYNGWSMGLSEKRLFLDHFLNVKYYVETENENVINFYRANGEIADQIKVQRPNVPVTHLPISDYENQKRYAFQDEDMFQFGFATNKIMAHQRVNPLVEGEFIEYFIPSGPAQVAKNEEIYLQSAVLNLENFEKLSEQYPHLDTLTYNTVVPYYKEYSTGASQANRRLVKTFYKCATNSYPYKNPTDEAVANVCVNSGPLTTLGGKDAIEYRLADGSNLLQEGGYLMFHWTPSSRVRVFLYDENDQVITFDDVYNAGSSTTFKMVRGMHAEVPVKKLVVAPIGDQNNQASYYMYAYETSTINTLLEKTKEYPLENVEVGTNRITFSTNYDQEKFVITTIPYDKGWTVRSIKADASGRGLEVFKTHGGFVGFMSEKGETDYVMQYVPEYFALGGLTTLTGFYIGIIGLAISTKKKKKKEVLASV